MKALFRVIAAFSLLAVFSCAKEIEIDVTPVETSEQVSGVQSYTMSIVAGKGEPDTKALSLSDGTLSATWAEGDEVIVYKGDAQVGTLNARSSGVSTTLSGTITGTIGAGDILTLSFLSPDYVDQEGTIEYIAAHCDYATATVTVSTVSSDNKIILEESGAEFNSRQAIVEFTLKESDGTPISDGVTSLVVTAGETTITVTPGSATNVLYVAVPAITEGSINLLATANDGTKRIYNKPVATFAESKYYEIGVKMLFAVTNEEELRAANEAKYPMVTLGDDITLTEGEVMISDAMTIELNGHSISGNGSRSGSRIFYIPSQKSLTITGEGTITGGNGTGSTGNGNGGAILNKGILTIDGGTFTGNTASNNGGCIYNDGVLTISGGSFTGNTAGKNGGGIFDNYSNSNPTVLNLSGDTVISDNGTSNLYLDYEAVVNVAGAFSSDASIGVTLAWGMGVFTSDYSADNSSIDPYNVFSADGGTYTVTLSGEEAAVALYHYVSTVHYTSLKDLLNKSGLFSTVSSFVVDGLIMLYFSNSDADVSAISYTYRSKDPLGLPVDLSALIYVPDAALTGTSLKGISLVNHGAYGSNAQCPTEKAQFEGAFAWKNYAVVMPDYYGFGVSVDCPQGFLDADNTAHNSIDAYLAAVQLLEDRKVSIPNNLYSFGYSQGGFNSMANLKYVTQHPELGIHFDKVFCGGSPFDVILTWNAYTNGSFRNSLAFIPMMLVSINETHKLGISYDKLFIGDLLDNYNDWILDKQYTTTEISNLLSPDPSNPSKISDILTEDMINGTGSASNSIMSYCRSYSLTSGWTPPSDTEIYLYHSDDDDTVPYDNLNKMKGFLDEKGHNKYTLYHGHNGGHMDAVLSYVRNIIGQW